MQSMMEGALADIQEHAQALSLKTGGSGLLGRVREWQRQRHGGFEASLAVEKDDREEAPDGAGADPALVLMAGIQDVTNAMLEECPINELLTMVLEVIYRSLHPNRVLFWVRDPKRGEMVIRFGFGKDIDQLLSQLRFALGQGGDVFNRALGDGRDIAIADIQDSKIAAQIPEWSRLRLATRTLLLYPLMIKQSPLGLISVDWDTPNRVPESTLERSLKTLCNQAVLEIRQRGNR